MSKDIEFVVGIDLGDRMSDVCVLDAGTGAVVKRFRVATERAALEEQIGSMAGAYVVMETGTHSLWIARLLRDLVARVDVVDARRVRLITHSVRKSDTRDADALAGLAFADLKREGLGLLRPIYVRSEQVHLHRAMMRARDAAVRSRTLLINNARGVLKALGLRVQQGSGAEYFTRRAREAGLPPDALAVVAPALALIDASSAAVASYDEQLEEIAATQYALETEQLRRIAGVGLLTALAFVLTIVDPHRFEKSREVGAYVGLVPGRDQSGRQDPRLGITKAGDPYLRRLLVSAATYIIHQGPDTALRRWGRHLMEQGGRAPGKRAATAVARKLAVLMHHLWATGEVYEPSRGPAKAA